MTVDHSEMPNTELVEHQQKTEKELAEISLTGKAEILKVEKRKLITQSLEPTSPKFCRTCDHPIWEYPLAASRLPVGSLKFHFYVEGPDGNPEQVTYCPTCRRKLSRSRLKSSDEAKELSQADSEIWYKNCVQCGHQIGLLRGSDPTQFFDEGDRQKPISACPICHTPAKESYNVDFMDEQRARIREIIQVETKRMAVERRSNRRRLFQLVLKE